MKFWIGEREKKRRRYVTYVYLVLKMWFLSISIEKKYLELIDYLHFFAAIMVFRRGCNEVLEWVCFTL
jgi:hypothetical protein